MVLLSGVCCFGCRFTPQKGQQECHCNQSKCKLCHFPRGKIFLQPLMILVCKPRGGGAFCTKSLHSQEDVLPDASSMTKCSIRTPRPSLVSVSESGRLLDVFAAAWTRCSSRAPITFWNLTSNELLRSASLQNALLVCGLGAFIRVRTTSGMGNTSGECGVSTSASLFTIRLSSCPRSREAIPRHEGVSTHFPDSVWPSMTAW